MLLTEILKPDRVVVPLAARDKNGVIAELARVLVEKTHAPLDEVLSAIHERESVLSTGIGFGVAIPHAKCPAVRELIMVGGVSADPVPYDSIDGEPVRLFFMIVGPESSAGLHVKLLSRIARLVRRDGIRKQLVESRTPDDFYRTLLEAEER